MHAADADVVAALTEAANLVLAACARTSAAQQAVRRMDVRQLWALADDRQVLEAQLAPRVAHARALLAALYQRYAVAGADVEALRRAAPAVGGPVAAALAQLHGASRRLRALDAEHRALSERALVLVRELARRLPTRADAYGRRGASVGTPHTTPTSSSAA